MKNEIEQIAQQNKMSIEFVTWFFNKKKSACGEHWFLMLGAMWEGWKGRSIEMDRLAAENVALKKSLSTIANSEEYHGDMVVCDFDTLVTAACSALHTPATDRIVAGIKADGVEEWVSSRGGRWNSTTEEALKYATQLRIGASE